MNIFLKSDLLTVVGINKKSSAKMFDKLKIGDIIRLSIEVVRVGTSRGRSYAPQIKVENIFTGECVFKTFNEIESVLSPFELQ